MNIFKKMRNNFYIMKLNGSGHKLSIPPAENTYLAFLTKSNKIPYGRSGFRNLMNRSSGFDTVC